MKISAKTKFIGVAAAGFAVFHLGFQRPHWDAVKAAREASGLTQCEAALVATIQKDGRANFNCN
jgi:hypothetical protein